jgi:hypothetical protein
VLLQELISTFSSRLSVLMVAIGSNCSNNLDLALDLLKSGHRIDARSKLQRRQIEIEFLEDYGSVCCSLGNTK